MPSLSSSKCMPTGAPQRELAVNMFLMESKCRFPYIKVKGVYRVCVCVCLSVCTERDLYLLIRFGSPLKVLVRLRSCKCKHTGAKQRELAVNMYLMESKCRISYKSNMMTFCMSVPIWFSFTMKRLLGL